MPPNGLSVFFLSRAAIEAIFSNKCPSTIDTKKNLSARSTLRSMNPRTFINNEDLGPLPSHQSRTRSPNVTSLSTSLTEGAIAPHEWSVMPATRCQKRLLYSNLAKRTPDVGSCHASAGGYRDDLRFGRVLLLERHDDSLQKQRLPGT